MGMAVLRKEDRMRCYVSNVLIIIIISKYYSKLQTETIFHCGVCGQISLEWGGWLVMFIYYSLMMIMTIVMMVHVSEGKNVWSSNS